MLRTKQLLLLSGIIAAMNLTTSCTRLSTTTITVTPEVISTGYIGNGAEWDPYDEAEAWGSAVSEADWQKLFARLDFMRPQYVRCMINSPWRYYDPQTGKYDRERNFESISRLLDYCTRNNITVMYGEYNPPTWEMKESQQWIDMAVDYLNYLVVDKGFTCIKYFVTFNEPDGDWASTNGDYEVWKNMMLRFNDKIQSYPELAARVSLAGPDVVVDYKNNASDYDAEGWVKMTAQDLDPIIGLYDIHAYPGQTEVRSGQYPGILAKYKQHVPPGKKIVLGEAGYKYWRPGDEALMEEYQRRAKDHPFTKGSDSNMLVYDYFYGLDMPLLAMEVMNAGYAGLAVWMLDDAMHSNGDSGKTEDIKLWGMWNILGEEVFGKPEEEEIRPWYYTWSLMCRYFPAGTEVLKTGINSSNPGVFSVAGRSEQGYTVAVVNVGDTDETITLKLPEAVNNANLYVYEDGNMPANAQGFPVPLQKGVNGSSYTTTLKAQSFILLTELKY